jgi:hypothetical protein
MQFEDSLRVQLTSTLITACLLGVVLVVVLEASNKILIEASGVEGRRCSVRFQLPIFLRVPSEFTGYLKNHREGRRVNCILTLYDNNPYS